jgi:galactitol-specific phosphotransferase system IIB component
MSARRNFIMERTVKVGVMPGRINEFVVDSSATVASVLQLAELDATGYEVKADGTKVTDFNQPIGSTNLILLTKQVKGNAEKTVKVGVMPGRINEFVVDSSTSISDVLALAELDASGYEVKADGTKVTDFSQPVGATNLILLTKQVKGNN